MSWATFYFLMGFYACGEIATFIIVMFFTMLGGKNEDLYKPFFYAGLWPYFVPKWTIQSLMRRS